MIDLEPLIRELGLQGVTNEFERATEAQVTALEERIGTNLPMDYREFLKACGASLFASDAVFEPVQPSPWATDGAGSLDVLYGISSDPGFDLGAVNSRLELPEGTVAIGHDSGSNLILLSPESGTISFFDGDTGRTYLIAQNFAAFLKSFRLR